MEKDNKINRRQFLTIVSGFCAGSIVPHSIFNFHSHNFKKTNPASVKEIPNMSTKYELPIINVIGVGGAGGNAINNIIDSNLQGVQFVAANTDDKALNSSKAPFKILIGEELTDGLGAGANPQIGRQAALENAGAIRNVLKGSQMVFITAGLGGGTGSGAAPVVAEICKKMETLTVAVVTKPFSFEGRKRIGQAEEGLDALTRVADMVIAIPNDKLRGLVSKNTQMIEMFRKSDEILFHSVKCITDLLLLPGLVGIDFEDIRTIISKSGLARMGTGSANGKNRAIKAAKNAISHPMIEDVSIAEAKGVIINITADTYVTMEEITQATELIYKEAGDDTDIIWGTVIDENLSDGFNVTLLATGIS